VPSPAASNPSPAGGARQPACSGTAKGSPIDPSTIAGTVVDANGLLALAANWPRGA
jgi:hypothetical protein